MSGKRYLFVLLLALLALALVVTACGQSSAPPSGDKKEVAKAPESKAAAPAAKAGQDGKYPSGTVRIIVPFKAGGAVDLAARLIQPYLSKYLNTAVAVDNVEGAGGKIGYTQMYKAKPDGYTLGMALFPGAAQLEKVDKADFRIMEMTPVINIFAHDYNGLVVPFDSPIKTLDDLKKMGQKEPIRLAGAGVGTNTWLNYVLLKSKVGLKLQYVPYNSGNESAMAAASKQADCALGGVVAYKPLADQKKLRTVVIVGPDRAPQFPGVPTVIEQGYPGAGFDTFRGLLAPPNLPPDILKILEDASAKAIADPAFIEASKKVEFEPVPVKSAEFKKMIAESVKMIEDLVPILKAEMEAESKK